jgi:hypothetical protein
MPPSTVSELTSQIVPVFVLLHPLHFPMLLRSPATAFGRLQTWTACRRLVPGTHEIEMGSAAHQFNKQVVFRAQEYTIIDYHCSDCLALQDRSYRLQSSLLGILFAFSTVVHVQHIEQSTTMQAKAQRLEEVTLL